MIPTPCRNYTIGSYNIREHCGDPATKARLINGLVIPLCADCAEYIDEDRN